MVKNIVKAVEQVQTWTSCSSQKKLLQRLKQLHMQNLMNQLMSHVNLGIDASKGEQVVRGSVVLPHAKGQAATRACFCKR